MNEVEEWVVDQIIFRNRRLEMFMNQDPIIQQQLERDGSVLNKRYRRMRRTFGKNLDIFIKMAFERFDHLHRE